MTAFDPRGAWTALVSPFTQSGEFDLATFTRLLNFQLAEGIAGLVPSGTTGESPTLSWEEQGSAVALAVRLAGSRVLAGAGSNSTHEAISGARDAWARGAGAVLLVDCYYNGPSSLELRTQYYEQVLNAVPDVRVVPYVIPGRTGCKLSSADLAYLHLQDPDRVPAVKSATGDLEHMRVDRQLAGPGLSILSGDDELTLTMMEDPKISASGVISVMSNIAPRAVSELCAALEKGDVAKAEELNSALAPLFSLSGFPVTSLRTLPNGVTVETVDKFRNPVPVKTMMAGLGMVQPVLRRPLGLMTAPAVKACREALQTVHRRSPSVLAPIEAAFGVSIAARLADDGVWSRLVG